MKKYEFSNGVSKFVLPTGSSSAVWLPIYIAVYRGYSWFDNTKHIRNQVVLWCYNHKTAGWNVIILQKIHISPTSAI